MRTWLVPVLLLVHVVTVHAEIEVRLDDPRIFEPSYGGGNDPEGLDPSDMTPTAVATADLDEDGIPDLVCGFAGLETGVLAVLRGNKEAIFPNVGGAPLRTSDGNVGPFHERGSRWIAPARPDFLAAGDFDRDGHRDVVVATTGDSALHLLAGTGNGGFDRPRVIELPGTVTALAAGEVHRPDGLEDLAVGLVGPDGPAVLVFQGPRGALHEEPEIISTTAAPTAFAFEDRGDGPWRDLAVAAGTELLVVHGRDRQLVLEPDMRVPGRTTVESLSMSSRPVAVTWARVDDDARSPAALIALLDDGSVRALSNESGSWEVVGRYSVMPPRDRMALVTARWSGSAAEDVVVVDVEIGRIAVLAASAVERDTQGRGVRFETVGTKLLDGPTHAVALMRLDRDALDELVLMRPGDAGPAVLGTGIAAVLTVNTALDNAVPGDGSCSLREAIGNANANSDSTGGDCAAGSGADTIEFNIAGGGAAATIALSSALPSISDRVTIDGTTQGCPAPPCVALDGAGAGAGTVGLTVAAGPSVVRGLAVHSFDSHGILVTSSGNRLEGNFVGTDLTGTLDQGNALAGVRLEGADNIVGGTFDEARNLLSGNDVNGAFVTGGFTGNRFEGNYVGTDVSGTLALPNSNDGIRIGIASDTTIGGAVPGAGNLVSGNATVGVHLIASATGNRIQGNIIGLDVTGKLALGNGGAGVRVLDRDNTVGGTVADARNVISANGADGLFVLTNTAINNEILGNFIGTDVTGGVDLGNTLAGAEVETGTGNTVGGAVPGAGNLISGNDDRGILLQQTSGNHVLGNRIGTDASGTADLGNTLMGVHIVAGSNNTIGGTTADARNVISGNDSDGVFMSSVTSGNVVQGNFIGTDVTGSVDLGNSLAGVEIDGSSTNNTIGGTEPGSGNVISGNDDRGILIESSNDNVVSGNLIGTDVSGTLPVGNALPGVVIAFGSGNTVGGTTPEARNVISGNNEQGVRLNEASGNRVQGNYIGTDVTGTVDLGNVLGGVRLQAASTNNTIGGATEEERNVIAANGSNGVTLTEPGTSGNAVQGNCIGTDKTCRFPMGNAGRGVRILADASGNTVGGLAAGEGNVISNNALAGVVVDTGAVSNAILGNSILRNGDLGIDLQEDGVTPNDDKDPDPGPNDLQNFPVLSLAEATPTPDVLIEGSLNSTNNTTFRIEFFASSDCDGSGHGEGERFLGFSNQATGGPGTVNFSVNLAAAVSDGEAITATATNSTDSTSEFSECLPASCTSLVEFAETILAQDKNTLVWVTAQDVRFAEGDLSAVGTYVTSDDGVLSGANSLDISGDNPSPGTGLYYVVKPLGCGSWQTTPGAEPGRDVNLP